MTRRRARALVAGTALVLAIVLAACGDDPSDEGEPAGGATTAAAATTAAGGGRPLRRPRPRRRRLRPRPRRALRHHHTTTIAKASGTADIVAVDFAFKPQNIEVTVGTKVTWTNNDTTTHQIVSKGDPFPGDGTIDVGETYSVTFDTPGTYDYFCGIHNSMTGSIVVS